MVYHAYPVDVLLQGVSYCRTQKFCLKRTPQLVDVLGRIVVANGRAVLCMSVLCLFSILGYMLVWVLQVSFVLSFWTYVGQMLIDSSSPRGFCIVISLTKGLVYILKGCLVCWQLDLCVCVCKADFALFLGYRERRKEHSFDRRPLRIVHNYR